MSPVKAPPNFNFASIWEMAADAVPDREALVVGDQRRTYAQLDERVRRLANHLAGQGIGRRDHVALYLENCPEYLEAMLAAFTLRAVPINVNHRYVADELRYLLDNSECVAVISQQCLAPRALPAPVPPRAVPINVNHRYVADELRYLLDNSDSVPVITQPSLAPTVHAVVGSGNVPAVRFTLVTGDEYDAALAAADDDRPAVARAGGGHG